MTTVANLASWRTRCTVRSDRLTAEGAEYYLCEALKSDNCKLTELHVYDNELTDEGAKPDLSDALKSANRKLTQM